MQQAGWKANETARRLSVSEGLISAYRNGDRTPPERTLELMRVKVRDHLSPESSQREVADLRDAPPMVIDFDDLLHEINEIKERVYALERKVQTARAAARGRAAAAGAAPSSNLPPGLVRGVARALHKKFARDDAGSSPSAEAGGSNVPSQLPPDRTGRPSSDRQRTPERAPESREGGKGSGHHKK